MRLLFTRSHKSAPGRYLVHAISPKFGELYLGVVHRLYDHCWLNSKTMRQRENYTTRKAAALALLT